MYNDFDEDLNSFEFDDEVRYIYSTFYINYVTRSTSELISIRKRLLMRTRMLLIEIWIFILYHLVIVSAVKDIFIAAYVSLWDSQNASSASLEMFQ
jgi:hypothetical protein